MQEGVADDDTWRVVRFLTGRSTLFSEAANLLRFLFGCGVIRSVLSPGSCDRAIEVDFDGVADELQDVADRADCRTKVGGWCGIMASAALLFGIIVCFGAASYQLC